MTKPLPTLADIDRDLARACETRAAAVLEIEQHRALVIEHHREIAGLWCAVAALDDSFDELLAERTRIAGLAAHA